MKPRSAYGKRHPNATKTGRDRIVSRGDLVEIGPRVGARDRLSLEELRSVGEQIDIPSAFRSDWLGLQYAPRLRPVFTGGEHLVNLGEYGWANWA